MPDDHTPGGFGFYTKEEVADEILRLRRDGERLRRLLVASRGLWRDENPGALVEFAIEKIRNAQPGTLSKEIPFFRTVIHNMSWIAADWGAAEGKHRSAEPTDPNVFGEIGGLDPGPTPEHQAFLAQLRTLVLERCGDDRNLAEYMRLRFFDNDLGGKDLQTALGVDNTEFERLRKAASRLLDELGRELLEQLARECRP